MLSVTHIAQTFYQNIRRPQVIQAGIETATICFACQFFFIALQSNKLNEIKESINATSTVNVPLFCAITAIAMLSEALSLKR